MPPGPPREADWQASRPERVVAGPSAPALGAWGVAVNPVSGEILVGDYVSAQVRRYSRDGRFLGDFTNPANSVGGDASALAVDPRNGDVYLAVVGDGNASRTIRKYDAQGRFRYDFYLPKTTAWIGRRGSTPPTGMNYPKSVAVDPATRQVWVAADASGIGVVDVRVRDLATGLYFDGRKHTWVASATWTGAVASGPPEAMNWRFTVSGTAPGRAYAVAARATDVHGNVSTPATTTVTVP